EPFPPGLLGGSRDVRDNPRVGVRAAVGEVNAVPHEGSSGELSPCVPRERLGWKVARRQESIPASAFADRLPYPARPDPFPTILHLDGVADRSSSRTKRRIGACGL